MLTQPSRSFDAYPSTSILTVGLQKWPRSSLMMSLITTNDGGHMATESGKWSGTMWQTDTQAVHGQ